MPYTSFLNQFPKIKYDISNSLYPESHETVTNIFIRIGIIKSVLNNISSYNVYEIDDGDTPDTLAQQVYNDAGAHWIILYANDMFDPQYDWPLPYDAFQSYIIEKYGSVETALTTVHHHEKVITRTLMPDNIVTETRFVVDAAQLTQNDLDVPYDVYFDLANTQSVETFNIDGKTLTQVTKGETIYCYDYENELNEKKRTIKVIKADYYPRIMDELRTLTGTNIPNRRLR